MNVNKMSFDIKDTIKKNRDKISESSIKTYDSILRNLYKKVYDDTDYTLKKFNNSSEILDFLQDLEPKKRKTQLAALVVLTDNNNYKEVMLDDIKFYNKEHSKQTKPTDNNWLEQNTIIDLYNDLSQNANIIYKKKKLTASDYQDIQNFIIMSLLSGVFIPPRRSKDYVNLKIDDIDKKEDNYISNDKFIFNSYKTAKTYGEQQITIPKELMKILKKWISINPTDYLLFDISYKKLSNVKLTQRLNKLFGKKASINQLRKSYLSSKFSGLIDINKELAKTMSDMGTSRNQETIYIKK